MAKITLQTHHWFVSFNEGHYVTNTYSGSVGTSQDQGCLSSKTFNYRVSVDASENEPEKFRIIAVYYTIAPWNEGGEKSEEIQCEFDGSEEGLEKAKAWLESESEKLGF